MRNLLYRFDTLVSTVVAALPASVVKPFHYLSYPTMPVVWFGYICFYLLISRGASMFGLACLILLPLGSLIKFLFKRQRPATVYAGAMRIKSYSFPSSHAYSAAVGGGYFGLLASTNDHPVLAASFAILIFVIGLSRVRLGAHYPSDVIAGWLLGLSLLAVAYRLTL